MLENEFYIADLITKHLKRALNTDENEELDLWLNSDADHRKFFATLVDNENLQTELQKYFSVDKDQLWAQVKSGIAIYPVKTRKNTIKLWYRISLTAAAVLIMCSALFIFYNEKSGQNSADYSSLIPPGHMGATLTLANGKKIKLSDMGNEQLAVEAGVRVTKTDRGELIYQILDDASNPDAADRLNTLSTSNGEAYMVILPDGSKVWLNAGSILRYPVSFRHSSTRNVRLDGEAYFEIAKDKSHPFLVASRSQEIKVLGTHFNINSYANESSVTTTLIEGSIELTTGRTKHVLTPGQQAINTADSVQVSKANVESVVDWKSGDFYLDHIRFKTALRKLERWYNIQFIYDVSISDDMLAGGWISRNSQLSTVLRLIEKSGQVNFKFEGNKIYVSKQ